MDLNNTQTIVEVGPGMGILTENLVKLDRNCFFVEIDNDAVSFLKKKYITISGSILNQDFLKLNLKKFKPPLAIIGNFPYNISSQIVFKIIENRKYVNQMVGMFQKEVAEKFVQNQALKYMEFYLF